MKKIDLTSPVEVWRCSLPRKDYAACDLTLFNLSGEQVTSVEVTLILLDRSGEELTRLIHRARSLNGAPGKAFMMSVPVQILPEAKDWEAIVEKVWYDNNSVWRRSRAPLTEYEPNRLPHSNARTNLRMLAGEDAMGYAVQQKGLWLCVCGRPNEDMTTVCARCRRERNLVFSRFTEEAVQETLSQREARLAAHGRAVLEEASRLQAARERVFEMRKKRRKKIFATLLTVLVLAGAGYVGVFHVLPYLQYQEAVTAFEQGEYALAEKAFARLESYAGSAGYVQKCRYGIAKEQLALGTEADVKAAREAFVLLGDYEDAPAQITECDYQLACLLLAADERDDAAEMFTNLEGYRDSLDQLKLIDYKNAEDLLESGELALAREAFDLLGDYADAPEMVQEAWYQELLIALGEDRLDDALTLAENIPDYLDTATLVQSVYYDKGLALRSAGEISAAAEAFYQAGDYLDAKEQASRSFYGPANEALAAQHYDRAANLFSKILDYEDSREKWTLATYESAKESLGDQEYNLALSLLETLPEDYQDVADLKQECVYRPAKAAYNRGEYETALGMFQSISGYSDADKQVSASRYQIALAHEEAGEWVAAMELYALLGDYEKAPAKLQNAQYNQASSLLALNTAEGYQTAADLLVLLGDYKDSATLLKQAQFGQADLLLAAGSWEDARAIFASLGSYGQAANKVMACDYARAGELLAQGLQEEAATLYDTLPDYADARLQAQTIWYALGAQAAANGHPIQAAQYYQKAGTYQDATTQAIALFDSYYAETAVSAQDAYDNGYYAMCVQILRGMDRSDLPTKYTYLNDLYTQACYAEATRLYNDGQPYAALDYYRDIPGYRNVNTQMEKPCYMLLGTWTDLKDQVYIFRGDGTCSIAGQEMYFNANGDHLFTGATKDDLKAAYTYNGVTKRNAWLFDDRTGTQVRIYLTRVAE